MPPLTARQKAKRLQHQKIQWKQAGYRSSYEVAVAGPQQLPCIRSNDKSRLNVLLNSGAFDDLRDPVKPVDEQDNMKQLLNAWVEDNEDCRVYRQPMSRAALKHDTTGYKIPDPSPNFKFESITSDERATLVVDKDGVILAYKFRMPEDLHQKLVESNLFLSQAKRANYSLWAKSTEEIAMSSDYRKHLPESENFFEHNRELWNVLDDVLRLLDPVTYKKYTNVDQFLKEDEKRLAGAWHGAIINRQTGSREEAVPHKNWKDWGKGITAMIPWGYYEGGDVKLYNLGLRFEMKPCDVLLVNARCVSYGVQELEKGVRNELDLVVQGTTIKWRHEKVTNGALKRAEERKRIERERRKREKEKQRRPLGRSIRAGGVGNGPRPAVPSRVRPPASMNSNAIPLGTRCEEEYKSKTEKDGTNAPAPGIANSNVIPLGTKNTNAEEPTKTELEINSTVALETTDNSMQPQNTPAGAIIQKVLKDRLETEAAPPPVTVNAALPGSNIKPPAKKSKKQRKAWRQATEKAVMDSIPTEGKTPQQIEQDKRQVLASHYLAQRTEEKKKNKVNKAAAKAARREHFEKESGEGKRPREIKDALKAEKGLADGETPKEINKELNAEKVERQREQAANRKRHKKNLTAKEHQRALAAANGVAVVPVEVAGLKRKRADQQSNGTENATKKPKVETENERDAARAPVVKRESAPATKVKSEPATKRKVTRENVGGRMRDVVCLD